MTKNKNHLVYQFLVRLNGIEPTIWRRIQVPGKYNFWDLHIAIQDSMGWLDYHLHAFQVQQKHGRKPLEIGIPLDERDLESIMPGWKVPITDYFTEPGQVIEYLYDFGDGWSHEILLEGILLKEKATSYPRCVGGERAGPPEDCGGIPGYYRLLDILRDPAHAEYEDNIVWLKGHAKNYYPYYPEKFDYKSVHFDSPKKRWRIAFLHAEEK